MRSYHAHCRNCNYVSSRTVGGVPALILDAPSDDADADPQWPQLILLDDLRGRETIARIGYTFISATLHGRYLRIREFFCAECGRLYQQRSLAPAFAQFIWPLWAVLAIPFMVLVFLISPNMILGIGNGLLFGMMAGGASLAVLDPAYRMYLRWRYPQRTSEFETKSSCPACGSKSKVAPGLYQGTIRCPECKMKTMTIESVETARAAEPSGEPERYPSRDSTGKLLERYSVLSARPDGPLPGYLCR